MKMLRKAALTGLLAFGIFGASLFAEDDFYIPLDIDFSAPETSVASTSQSSLKQGLWIETSALAQSLTRDIATGEMSGYELDNVHFKSNANWWFWGDISPKYHLDAEIAVWNFDVTMFQSNSFAANVPDVTFGDGLMKLLSMPFSFLYNGAGDSYINKFGFTFKTPYVNAKAGMGGLGKNGMSGFTGIYNVIDPWLDTGKGFTEITNGDALKEFGDVKIDALAALSMMRGTYGTYGYVNVSYADLFTGAVTWGSYTDKELFFYNENNVNSASLYAAYNPMSNLKVEGHALATFGTDIDFGLNTMAFAARISYEDVKLNASLMQSYAGKDVNSVWGSDGQTYDLINANSMFTKLDVSYAPFSGFTVGLDETALLSNVEALMDDSWNFRTEPYAEIDFNSLAGFDLAVALYGVVNLDKTPAALDSTMFVYFEEAGIELETQSLPFANKITLDYACSLPWYDDDVLYKTNSILYQTVALQAEFSKNVNAHIGSVIRTPLDGYTDPQKVVPFGIACGVAFESIPLPGNPKLWIHGTYGMSPYSENNYSLYRADNSLNNPSHKTYLLNDLEAGATTSEIAFGLIWNL